MSLYEATYFVLFLNLLVKFYRIYIFCGTPPPPPPFKAHILFYSNVLAIWHGFPNMSHFEVDNGHKSAMFIFIQLNI